MAYNATGGPTGNHGVEVQGWPPLADKFASHHTQAVNIFLHLITTPVGLVGAVSLVRCVTASTSITAYFVLLYLLSLLPSLSTGVYLGTALMCAFIVYTTRAFKLGWVASVLLVVIAYILQDLSHLGCGEDTLQQSYSGGAGKHVSLKYSASTINIQALSHTSPLPPSFPSCSILHVV